MLDRQAAGDDNINNTAVTTASIALVESRVESKSKPEDINKVFTACFVFIVAIGMFQFGKLIR